MWRKICGLQQILYKKGEREMFTEDALAKCPYYREDGGQAVRCEGPCARSSIQLSFGNRYQLRDYKEQHCHEDWKTCPVADMLNRKYDYIPA